MPDEEPQEEGTEEEGGGKSALIPMIGIGVGALLAGLGGGYVAFKPTPEMIAAVETVAMLEEAGAEDEEALAEAGEQSEDFQERLVTLDSFIVNLTGDGYSRYVKLTVALESSRPEVNEELTSRMAQVRDTIIVLLSSKRLSDITDFEGKALLKEDIRMRLNDVVGSGEIRSVMFTEFVVQ